MLLHKIKLTFVAVLLCGLLGGGSVLTHQAIAGKPGSAPVAEPAEAKADEVAKLKEEIERLRKQLQEARDDALQQRNEALKQRDLARKQQARAEDAQRAAQVERQRAEEAAAEAQLQRAVAEKKRQEAEAARQEAVDALARSILRPLGPPALDAKEVHDLLGLVAVRDRKTLDINLQRQLEKLDKSKVPTADKAKEIAIGHRLKAGGVLAEEGARAVGLFRLGVELSGFSKVGDLIWVIRFAHLSRGVTQELWVSSTTGEVRATLPLQGKPGK